METLTEPRLDAIESKFNSIEFRAHAHLVHEYDFDNPLSVKGPFRALRRLGGLARRATGGRRRRGRRTGPSADLGLPGIGRQARSDVAYERHARDADGDGLLQEGTIWERRVGSGIHAADGSEMATGARASALAGQRHTVRNAAGQRIQYRPGDDPSSPLRRGRAGAQRVVRRAQRRHVQADRDVEVGRAHRELVSEEDAQRRILENAIAVESFNRWMEAEEQRRGLMGDDQRDWLDGLMEGWSGVRQGMKKQKKGSAARRKLSKVHRRLMIAEGERRFRRARAGIENEEEDWEDEEEFDDKVLPEGVDREEHNRKMREDPDYRAKFIRALMDMEAKENRDREYVHPPGYVSQPGDEDYELPELPDEGGLKVPRGPLDPDEVEKPRRLSELRVVDLTDEELASEIRRLKGKGKNNLGKDAKDRLTRLGIEQTERKRRADKTAAEEAAADEEANAEVIAALAKRFKQDPEGMSYDEKKKYLDSLDRPELEEIYKDLTGFDATKSWSRTGPKTPNLVDKIIKSQEPPPEVVDPDELDDEGYAEYLKGLGVGELFEEAKKHYVPNRSTPELKKDREKLAEATVAARKDRREIADISNMDSEAITAERDALLRGKNPDDLTKEQLARIAVLDDALKDGVEDSLEAYMEYLKETKGKLRSDLKKRLKAKPDEAAKPKKKPEPAGPVDDSGKPIPPPPDLKPADVVPEDVVPEEALEELAPDLVGPRETHDPGGTFTWAAGRPFEGLTNDELEYEIRRQLSYEAAGGTHDLAKHSALNEEWLTRNPDSDEDVDPLGDETPIERATAIREFQEVMRSEVGDDWKEVAEGLEVLREELDSDVLPDFKFWSEENDPFGEREELFGKYYHVSGELNDRGVLLNEQIVGKDEDDEPEVPEDEAEIVEQIEEIDDAVEEIVDTARDRREPAAQPVPDDPRFTPTLEEGDIRISENIIVHTSNTDDDVRPMLLVQMPDGTVQAFYRRTGSGNRGDEAERIEAGGGGGKGNWVPFDGFGGRMGKNWFRKGESNPAPNDGPLFRYGTEELKAAGQALDASENVQAMLDDPDRQVHIVHSDPSQVGGELMLDPDDPTIQRTSEELNEILGLPSTEEYIASLVKPEDVDVPEDVPEPDEVSPGAVVPEPEAATPKPEVERPPAPEVRIPKWDRLNDGTEYRVVLHNRSTDKTQDPYAGELIIERRGGKGQDGFYRVKPSGREGDYETVGLIKNFDEDVRDDFVGKRFRSVDDPWPDGTSEDAPKKVPVQVVARRTASEFWTELPEGLSAEDVGKLIADKRQERADKGELSDIESDRLDEEIMAEIIAERTDAPEAVEPEPEVVPEPPETPASLAETDEMEFYFGGSLPSTLTSGKFDETLESLRAGVSADLNKEQHRNRLALFETHQTLSTGNPKEVVAAMSALLRHDEELGDDPADWERRVILTRMDEAIRALNGRAFKWTEPRDVMERRQLLEARMERRDTAFDVEVADEDVVPSPKDVDADVPEDVLEFDFTREELGRLLQADEVTANTRNDDIVAILLDMNDDLDPDVLQRLLQADRITGKKKDEIVAILLDMSDDLDSEDLKKMTVKELKKLIADEKANSNRTLLKLVEDEKAKSRATLLKLVEDERAKGRTLNVTERSSNAQIIDALLDMSEDDDDDDAERLMPETARFDDDQGDAEVDEPAPTPVSDSTKIPELPTRLRKLREDVADFADLEARKTNLTVEEIERHKKLRNSVGPGGYDLDELAEEEAAYKRTLDRSGFVIDDDTKKITKKPGPSKAERARAVQVRKEVDERLAVEAQARAVVKKSRLRRIWDKLKEMSPADRRLVKLNRETETEKKDRLDRVRALRAKGETRTDDENVELRDLEDVEAAVVKNPLLRGTEDFVSRKRALIDRLEWDGDGESSSLVGLTDEELVERRETELGEGKEKVNTKYHGGFSILIDRTDAVKAKNRGDWRLKLTEREGMEYGRELQEKDAIAAQKKAVKAAREAGRSVSEAFDAGMTARDAVMQQPVVRQTHRPLKRAEIKEHLLDLEDALVNKLLAEWGLERDEKVTVDSRWAAKYGMDPKGGPLLIKRTGPETDKSPKIPARYEDGSEEGSTEKDHTLDAVTLDDGEVEAVEAALADYPVGDLEVLPSRPFWDGSEDDPATVELFSRYYSETPDETLYLNNRGLWVNNVLNGVADPSKVEREKQSKEISAVSGSPKLSFADVERFVKTGKRGPESEERPEIVEDLRVRKGEGGPTSALKRTETEDGVITADIDQMIRVLSDDPDAGNPFELDDGDSPLTGAAGERPPGWGNVARQGAKNVDRGNRKAKTVRAAVEEAARRKREEADSLPPSVPAAEDHPDRRLQEMIGIRDSRVTDVLPLLEEFPEFEDGTEGDPIKRVVKHSNAAKKEADVLRAKREAFDADAASPYSEEEEERLEKLEEYEKALADTRKSIMAVKGRLRTLSATGRDDPPLTGAPGSRPWNWDDRDREQRKIFEAEFNETMAGMTLEQVEAIADGRVVWEGPDPFDDRRETVRVLRRLARIEARRRRREGAQTDADLSMLEPESPVSEDLDADWKRAHGLHVGEWPVNPNDEKYGRRTLDNTLRQGPNWPPGLDPGTVGDDMSLEELQVLGTEVLKAIRFNTLEDEGIEVDENERAAHLRHSLHTLNNELLEDVLFGVYKRLEREGDGFERGSDAPGYPPIRPRSDEQVEWDRMAEEMETWTEEQWDEAADRAAEAMVEAFRGWLEENDVEVEAPPEVPDDPEYAETVAMHRELVRSMSSDALRELVDEYLAKPFATQEIEKDGYLNVLDELEERARAREQHQADRPPEHDDVRTAITEDDGEFRVRLFINGRHQAGADYFTDDREEAEETAKAMEADAHISDKTTDFAQDEAADFDQMEIDGRSIPLSLAWADDPEVQRLHDAMYPPEKALYYGDARSDMLEEARQHDPNSQEGIVYEVMASTVVEAEFMTDAQIDEQIRRLADVPETDQVSGLLRGVVPTLLAQPMSDDPNVVGRVAGLQTARLINFSLKEQFAKREMRLHADGMSVDELNALIRRMESHRDTEMVEMEFNGIVLFGDDDKYLLDKRIEALWEMVHYKQNMDPRGETYWGPEEGVVLPRGVERLEGPYPFVLTDEGDLEYIPNLTGPTDALDADFDASISNLLRNAGPTARADALVDMLKRLKAHQGELDPDMYRESRRRHLEQLEEALNEMDPEEQEEYLAGLGNFYQEIGLSTSREGDGLDLSGHDLPDKDWANTDLESIGADPIEGFKEANFHGSNLSRGDFRGVDLRGADFTGTRLDDADFTGADLRGANFDGAVIDGADFTDARLDGANFDGGTGLPKGLWTNPTYERWYDGGLIETINSERAREGLPPLTPEEEAKLMGPDDSDPPLTGGVPRGPISAGRGRPLRDWRGRFIDRVFDPDADYTFEDLEEWSMEELREAASSLDVSARTGNRNKRKNELIEDILARDTERGRLPRRRTIGQAGVRNEEPSLVQRLEMLRNQYRNAETVGDQDEMDRIANELRGLGGGPFTRRRRPDRGRRIDRGDPPLTGDVPGGGAGHPDPDLRDAAPFRRGVDRTNVNEAMERYDSLGLEELRLGRTSAGSRHHSPQRLRDLRAAREELHEIADDPTLPRGLRDQALGDIRDLTDAINAEEHRRGLGYQEAWNVQYAELAKDLLNRIDEAVKAGRLEDLYGDWEDDATEAVRAWPEEADPDDRPRVLRDLQNLRLNLENYRSAVGTYEGVLPRAREILDSLEIFPEEEGYVTDDDLGELIGELQGVEEALVDMPMLYFGGDGVAELRNKRDMLTQRVRNAIRDAMYREREIDLGPLGEVEEWAGDDLDGSTALLSIGMRPRPAGLGIAGDVVDGFVRAKRVPIGHKGIKTRQDAATHVRSGGDISDVPDEYLTHALLTNSSVYPGERFLRTRNQKRGIYILRQRKNQFPDEPLSNVYGQEGFVIKASTSYNEVSVLSEWAAAEVLHNLGYPLLPYRMSGSDTTETRDFSDYDAVTGRQKEISSRGASVVMEFAWNGHPLGELLSPDHSSDGFDESDFAGGVELGTFDPDADAIEVQAVGLEGRLMNWLARLLLSDQDGHPGNAISARAIDGMAGVVPIDLEGGFQIHTATSLYEVDDMATKLANNFLSRGGSGILDGFYMDRTWRSDMLKAIEKNPELEQRFETIIRMAVERFKMMLSDPNWVERLASAGPYSDLAKKPSLEQWRDKLESYVAYILPRMENVDGIVDAILGRGGLTGVSEKKLRDRRDNIRFRHYEDMAGEHDDDLPMNPRDAKELAAIKAELERRGLGGDDIVDTDPSVKEFDPSSDKMLAVMDYINTCLESAA